MVEKPILINTPERRAIINILEMEKSLEEYFDTSNDIELHENALEKIGDHYKDSFLQLIVDLKESLTGDERVRGRATELIYNLL